MLEAVAGISATTIQIVKGIGQQMAHVKRRLRAELPQLYAQDLLNNLFRHPYTRIEFVMNDLCIVRQTAAKYLDVLVESGFFEKQQIGRNNYYINTDLVELFLEASEDR